MKAHSPFRLLAGVAVAATVAAIGCNRGTSVDGTVTFQGQPVKKGSIRFQPADGQGPSVGAMIEEGEYHVEQITPGEKIVTLTATDESKIVTSRAEAEKMIAAAEAQGREAHEAMRAELIPPDHPKNGQTVEIQEGPQTLDFDL